MIFINKSMTLKTRSCLTLKFFHKYSATRTSCTTVRHFMGDSVFDGKNFIDWRYRRFNLGLTNFLSVGQICTGCYNVRYQLISYNAGHCETRALLSSSFLPLSILTDEKFYYSTGGQKKSNNGISSDYSDKTGECNIDITTESSDRTEKIRSSDPLGDGNDPQKKLSLFQKFKTMYRDYWYVLLPVHCVTSVFWFGGFYFLAESGVDIVRILEYIGINETLIEPFRNGHGHVTAGILAVAFALYKIATPVRYAVTLGGTTVAINYLKKWGLIKPIPKKEQLKAMYLEQKDILLEKKQQLMKSNMLQHLKEVDRTSDGKKN